MSVTSQNEMSTQPMRRRGCFFYLKRATLGFSLVLIALVLLGVGYQTVASELDKRSYAPRGQIYTVNGHQMHLVCNGSGSPAVILQAGASAESLWWYRVQQQLAPHTQVCAYDRPGMGWSDPVEGSRDPLTINAELHTLLDRAGIPAPYVMAGHSYGAILTRVYAAQYPNEVAGIILVDSQLVTPKRFASEGEVNQNRSYWDIVQGLGSVMTRVGLTRLIGNGDFQRFGYPPEIAQEIVGLQARLQVVDAYYAENGPAFPALQAASAAAENLGDLPVSVLWASQTNDQNQGNPSLRPFMEELSTYSTTTVTRVVEGANHGSILGMEEYARQVSEAVLDLIDAVQTGKRLGS
ncbi:MAG: alpha/beta hydrolase [Anaerolineae bacterium]|nr:alpha/beta hydrolase [Anaerolineae bacterium]